MPTVNATPRDLEDRLSAKGRKIVDSLVCAEDIEPVEMKWLWYPLIPAGSLTLIEGHPGLGKSTITCALAADLSAGRALPNDGPREPMKVLMFSTEDLAEAIIIKRLKAHDA